MSFFNEPEPIELQIDFGDWIEIAKIRTLQSFDYYSSCEITDKQGLQGIKGYLAELSESIQVFIQEESDCAKAAQV